MKHLLFSFFTVICLSACGPESNAAGWFSTELDFPDDGGKVYFVTNYEVPVDFFEQFDPPSRPDYFYYTCHPDKLEKWIGFSTTNTGLKGTKVITFTLQFDNTKDLLERAGYVDQRSGSEFGVLYPPGHALSDKSSRKAWDLLAKAESVSIYSDGSRETAIYNLTEFHSLAAKLPSNCGLNQNWSPQQIKAKEIVE